MVFQKNIASHDYPFYNKQLKQMRKFVKEMEEKAAHTFVISSFD
jgi:hypothetical protein